MKIRHYYRLAVLFIGVSLWCSPRGLSAQDASIAVFVDSVMHHHDHAHTPGAAVLVYQDGEVVFSKGYGMAHIEYGVAITPSTIFHVASVSKQFTAYAITVLAQQGKLTLDDDIRSHLSYIPDFGQTITVRHLIHHTSGLRDQWELLAMAGWRLDDVITKDHILSLIKRQRALNFEPGSQYLYSNMGYTLLAEIVEAVSGEPIKVWLEKNVFNPLRMTRTHFHDDHEEIVPGRAYSYYGHAGAFKHAVLSYANVGATSLFTTATDLGRWMQHLDQLAQEKQPLWSLMTTNGVLNNGYKIPYAHALVHGTHRGLRTIGHNGADAGFRSFMRYYPDQRVGIILLSNEAGFNGAPLNAIATRMLSKQMLDDDAPQSVPTPRPTNGYTPIGLNQYAGTYYSEELETTYDVYVDGEELIASHSRLGPIRLTPRSEDRFDGSTWYFRHVQFVENSEHEVTGFKVTGSRVRNLEFTRMDP